MRETTEVTSNKVLTTLQSCCVAWHPVAAMDSSEQQAMTSEELQTGTFCS